MQQILDELQKIDTSLYVSKNYFGCCQYVDILGNIQQT